MTIEPEKFRAFEQAGWENVPRQYDHAWGGLTAQTIPALLDAVSAGTGVNLLDIASGPGYVAAAAAKLGAAVVGVDFSAAMVAEAQGKFPGIEFRVGDAENLPFADGSFSAAVMNFGMLHLARPERALFEACRVLRTGGSFAFTVWAKPEEAIGFGIVLGAIQRHGNLNVQLPEGPPFFRFSESDECARSLIAAGFQSPKVTKIPQVWRLPAVDGLFNAMKESTVRTAGLLGEQTPEALIRIRDAIHKKTEAYQKGDVVELPMPAILASGMKLGASR